MTAYVLALHWDANPLRGIPAGPLPAMPHKAPGWMYDARNTTRNTGAFEMALNSIYLTSDSLTHADLN